MDMSLHINSIGTINYWYLINIHNALYIDKYTWFQSFVEILFTGGTIVKVKARKHFVNGLMMLESYAPFTQDHQCWHSVQRAL